MIENLIPILIDYGIGGIFVGYLIYKDHLREKQENARMKRFMDKVDSIELKQDELFREQRAQDKAQQDKLFELLRNK